MTEALFRDLTSSLSEEYGKSQQEFETRIRTRHLASTASLGDDGQMFRTVLSEELTGPIPPGPLTIIFMARFGLISQAQSALESLERETPVPGPLLEFARAEIELAEGKAARAEGRLRKFLSALETQGPAYFLASDPVPENESKLSFSHWTSDPPSNT